MASLISILVTLPAAHSAGKDKSLPVSIYCTAYADGLKSVFVKSGEDRYQSVSLSTANVIGAGEALVEDGRILLSSARWASRNDRRTLVCFQLDPVSKRMVVKSVPLRGNPFR